MKKTWALLLVMLTLFMTAGISLTGCEPFDPAALFRDDRSAPAEDTGSPADDVLPEDMPSTEEKNDPISEDPPPAEGNAAEDTPAETSDNDLPDEIPDDVADDVPDDPSEEAEGAEETQEIVPASALGGITSLDGIPPFGGEPYVELNGNVPDFVGLENCTVPFEIYSEFDSLGRCGPAFANICRELMPTETRQEIGMIKPSGWHTVRYDDLVDGKYLYNRCHLIGYQLAGENANEKNLITGTRWMNTIGMLTFENLVESYVSKTGNHVLYRATPVFDGNDLVAAGVQLEGLSVEDAGDGICFNVFVYNVQPGIVIDYANGDSHEEKTEPEPVPETPAVIPVNPSAEQTGSDAVKAQEPTEEEPEPTVTYILNTNTKKFHYPYCSSVEQMKEKNKKPFYGSRDDAVSAGYSPCGKCKP